MRRLSAESRIKMNQEWSGAMNKCCVLLAAVAIVCSGFVPGSALAQDSDRERERAIAAEEARIEARLRSEESRLEAMRAQTMLEREAEIAGLEVEREMAEAESIMAEAARRIAELSMRRFPASAAWSTGRAGRPLLGVTLAGPTNAGPVEGVKVTGVSPGGAASEVGMRAGDVITALNDESLSADSDHDAHQRVVDFMSGVEAGDRVDVEFLRSGKSRTVTLEPRNVGMKFSFQGPDMAPAAPLPPTAPVPYNKFVYMRDGPGFGDMEMVRMTETLGRYFGTAEGLLVVRAPKDGRYQLVDGDVILDVDGRRPKSVSHAVRILGSYQAGENLKLSIMRDKKQQTVIVEMPEASVEESVSRAND